MTLSLDSSLRRWSWLFLLLLTAIGCGGATDNSGTGGASSSGGTSLGAGGQAGTSGGSTGSGGLGGNIGWGGGLVIGPEPPAPPPTLEEFLEYRVYAPQDNDLPETPSDYVPPLPVGDAGWRNSTDVLCSELPDQRSGPLWADAAGVAVLTAGCPVTLDAPCGSGSELWYNDGNGWQWLFGLAIDVHRISGVAGGDLLVPGIGAMAIGRDGELHGASPYEAGYAGSLFGDGLGAAYGTFDERTNQPGDGHLYRFDGVEWTELGAYSGWSYASQLTVVDEAAYVVSEEGIGRAEFGSGFEALEGVPSGYYADVAGLSEDDLWAADFSGTILHYDGDGWTPVGAFAGEFEEFLVAEDEVYFISSSEFGRVTETDVELLQDLDTGSFTGLAGVSATEIFVSVIDSSLNDYNCGGLQIFVYDGEEFHQF